jgi:hypothetical protein
VEATIENAEVQPKAGDQRLKFDTSVTHRFEKRMHPVKHAGWLRLDQLVFAGDCGALRRRNYAACAFS